MATKTYGFFIDTNGVEVFGQIAQEAGKTNEKFKSLKQELRALNNAMLEMDSASAEFQKASQRASQLKDQIGDLAQEVNANAGGAFESASNNVALFQSRLMSLDFAGAGQALLNIATNIRAINFATLTKELGGFVQGLGVMGEAILTNPLFLIPALVTTIILSFDKWSKYFPIIQKAITGLNEEEIKGLKIAEQRTAASTRAYENIEKTANILRLQGKSEREILQMKMESLKLDIANRETQLAITEQQAITQIETAKRNKEIVKGIVAFITAPLQLILWTVDQIASFAGVTTNLQKDFNDFASSFGVDDPIALENELKNTIQANKDAIRDMKNEYAGLEISIQKMDNDIKDNRIKNSNEITKTNKKNNEEQDKDNKQNLENRLKYEKEAQNERLDEIERIQEEIYQASLSQEQKEIRAIQDKYFEQIELAKQFGLDATNLELEQQRLIQAIKDKYAKENLQQDAENKKKEQEQQKEFNNAMLEAEQKLYEAKWSVANAGLDVLSTLAGKNKKIADALFLVQKGLSIAQIVVDTQKEIAGYYANPTWSLMPDGGLAIKTANATAAKLRAVASIATIVGASVGKFMNGGGGSNVGGNGGGGGNMGGTNAPSPLSLSFLQNQPNQQPPFQAYVISGQVSNSIEAQQLINNQSKL
jgi:hypothetical protein